MAIVPTIMTADEVNCLIYSYFQDSGFTHSAFAVKNEAHLDRSIHFRKHIPRGELVELLSKALLYIEVESHWNGSALALNCRSPFSLLDPHICSFDPSAKAPVLKIPPERPNIAVKPLDDDMVNEKQIRLAADDRMDIDSNSTQPASDQEEGSKTGTTTPYNADNASTLSQHLQSNKRQSGPDVDITDPGALRLLKGHQTEVFVCGWNPVNPNLLGSGSQDAIVRIWELPPSQDGEPSPPRTFAFPSKADHCDLTSLDWNSEGSLLAVGSYDAELRICTAEGEMYMTNSQHAVPIFATRFSPSGRWLLTAGLDGTVCVWDVESKTMIKQYSCHEDCCLDIDWLDDSTFASCGADKLIHIMRLDASTPVRTLEGHSDEINQIKSNKLSTRLASCSDDKTARIWNVESGSIGQVLVLRGHQNSVCTVAWSPHTPSGQNEILATSGFDGTARLWDSVTGQCLKAFDDHKQAVYAVSFCPDGMWLATGSGDGWVHVYDVPNKVIAWSWFAGTEKPGVFEIDWQKVDSTNRIAFALESRHVGVVDVTKVTALQRPMDG